MHHILNNPYSTTFIPVADEPITLKSILSRLEQTFDFLKNKDGMCYRHDIHHHPLTRCSELGSAVSLKWRDEEQDLITISTDAELTEVRLDHTTMRHERSTHHSLQALSHCQSIGPDWLLRLFLVLKDDGKTSTDKSELAGVVEVKRVTIILRNHHLESSSR